MSAIIVFSVFNCRSAEVNVSDFKTHVPGLTLTEALRFRHEGQPEFECYSAPISLAAKCSGVVDSHVTSNPAISNKKGKETRIKTETLSLLL